MRTPKPIFYVLLPGRILFWDGLVRGHRDPWDGPVLTLSDHDGEVQRVISQGSFDMLVPILLHKNVWRPYPFIRMGNQN